MTKVIKLGGAVCAQKETVAQLAQQWRRSGRPSWIIVHGGGPQLDLALDAMEGEPQRVDGLRVTSSRAAEVVRKTMDLVGADLAAQLRAEGARAKHVPSTARLFQAVIKQASGDLGRVGTVTAFEAQHLGDLARPGHLAVVTPVGWDAMGPLNINADEGAVAVATDAGAGQLLLATNVDGVLDENGTRLGSLTPSAAKAMIGNAAKGGMIPKLRNALDALSSGVGWVDIGRLEAAWNPLAPRTRLAVSKRQVVTA